MSSGVSELDERTKRMSVAERSRETSNAEQANEVVVRANEQTEERTAQNLG